MEVFLRGKRFSEGELHVSSSPLIIISNLVIVNVQMVSHVRNIWVSISVTPHTGYSLNDPIQHDYLFRSVPRLLFSFLLNQLHSFPNRMGWIGPPFPSVFLESACRHVI